VPVNVTDFDLRNVAPSLGRRLADRMLEEWLEEKTMETLAILGSIAGAMIILGLLMNLKGIIRYIHMTRM
jgi:hypothetical protein